MRNRRPPADGIIEIMQNMGLYFQGRADFRFCGRLCSCSSGMDGSATDNNPAVFRSRPGPIPVLVTLIGQHDVGLGCICPLKRETEPDDCHWPWIPNQDPLGRLAARPVVLREDVVE